MNQEEAAQAHIARENWVIEPILSDHTVFVALLSCSTAHDLAPM